MSVFIYKKPSREVAREQASVTGNPPRDMVASFNYPYKLKQYWHLYAVEGNLWRVRLSDDQVMTGANVDTSVAEGNFNFEHIIRDFYFFQYVRATGLQSNEPITWEWAKRIGGDYYPIRAGYAQPEFNIAVEEIMYRSNWDDYRFRFNGNANNNVTVELWVEVLRI